MEIPQLSQKEIDECLLRAKNSERRRYLKILHQPGDELNRTINFMMSDTYMQPHNHPPEEQKEKIEKFQVLQGKIGILFFDTQGTVTKSVILEKGHKEYFEILPGMWHAPIILSESALCYEEVRGVYNPATYKELATWAPPENTPESAQYLNFLKSFF